MVLVKNISLFKDKQELQVCYKEFEFKGGGGQYIFVGHLKK